jgi:hypothetical protein
MADRLGILVWVTAPKGMSQQQVRHEVLNSIAFGHPEAQVLYCMDEPDDDPAVG